MHKTHESALSEFVELIVILRDGGGDGPLSSDGAKKKRQNMLRAGGCVGWVLTHAAGVTLRSRSIWAESAIDIAPTQELCPPPSVWRTGSSQRLHLGGS